MEENDDLRKTKDKYERQKMNLSNENMILNAKLTNLENIYIGSDIIRHTDGSVSNNIDINYNMTNMGIILALSLFTLFIFFPYILNWHRQNPTVLGIIIEAHTGQCKFSFSLIKSSLSC